ncbi:MULTISPECIES: cell division protein SepF [Streptococcus]|uniref:Cell division protein SepF n=2 Tax=Streptococcus TaxID=1301 RepID=A0A081JIY4_STRMC|nr:MULTISPECIES: cell division protein SepF [Streptococcus]CCF01855.1 FtsZ-interacting protein related to cell division [Streptococcus macedonicus ACA-DC 198]ALT81286.1 cell division protein SepF [Streptococcus gallolyticus]KEH52797.1 cell division protein SepF [Streptococcus macedonicus]MBF6975870.1 cell division protein SepF [Streptococcus macedonicus]MBT1047734.1 cell division protein SepF [Streptococcus macedonicus]
MAFKDKFDKLISYFDTDEVSDVEETVEEEAQRPRVQQQAEAVPQQAQRRAEPVQNVRIQQVQGGEAARQRLQQPQHRRAVEENQPVRSINQRREEQMQVSANQATTTITLKFPRKYEDAQEIVDLLIVNECVLIDFQYMLDAQARRCLDFIDGASKVLYGSLQKVGSSMYLLTPSNVIVNVEELAVPNNGQDIGFDFDMKRR